MSNGTFICKGCNNELPEDYSIKTEGYCYLCDPNVTVKELLESTTHKSFSDNMIEVEKVKDWCKANKQELIPSDSGERTLEGFDYIDYEDFLKFLNNK